MIEYLLLFLMALTVSYFLTPLVRKYSLKMDLVDYHKSQNKCIITRLGGLAIIISFVTTLGLTFILYHQPFVGILSQVSGLFLGIIIIMSMGIYDDIKKLSAKFKFGIQLVVALLMIGFGFRLEAISLPFYSGTIHPGWVSLPLTLFWIVGITNTINLIDGLDGLAAGIVFIASISLFGVAVIGGDVVLALFTAILAGSTLGFLRHNLPPAKIFMGDTGSNFLGYILALLALLSSQPGSGGKTPFIIFVVVLGVPILDTSLAIIRRTARGVNIFQADKDHLHHKLIHRGLSHLRVLMVLYGLSALLGFIALALFIEHHILITISLILLGAVIISGLVSLKIISDFGWRNSSPLRS
ncbi:MAG: MraY family glycosyltransferase [bacterium]